MAFLTLPSERYRESYLVALQEFQDEGRTGEHSPAEVESRFASFVQRLRDQADRANIKPGRVPCSIFWLIEDDIYIGRISLRHELNESLLQIGGHIGYVIRPSYRRQGYGTLILKYGLDQARAHALARVLLTCDENNPGSRKIIVANGGMLENIIEFDSWPVKVCRYWIQL